MEGHGERDLAAWPVIWPIQLCPGFLLGCVCWIWASAWQFLASFPQLAAQWSTSAEATGLRELLSPLLKPDSLCFARSGSSNCSYGKGTKWTVVRFNVTQGPKTAAGEIWIALVYFFSSDLCHSVQRVFHATNTRYLHVLLKKSGKWLQVRVLPPSQPRDCGCQHWLYFSIFCTSPHLTPPYQLTPGYTGTS